MKDVEADLRIEREWRERLQVLHSTEAGKAFFNKNCFLNWLNLKPIFLIITSKIFVLLQKYFSIRVTDIDNDIQESAVIDKESLSAAKQEIDFLRLSIFDPFLFPISLVIIFQALCIIK